MAHWAMLEFKRSSLHILINGKKNQHLKKNFELQNVVKIKTNSINNC